MVRFVHSEDLRGGVPIVTFSKCVCEWRVDGSCIVVGECIGHRNVRTVLLPPFNTQPIHPPDVSLKPGSGLQCAQSNCGRRTPGHWVQFGSRVVNIGGHEVQVTAPLCEEHIV